MTTHHVCGTPTQGETLVADGPYDDTEVSLLTLLRQVFMNMDAQGQTNGCAIVLVARLLFPDLNAPDVTCAAIRFTQVMATGRTERFVYSNPACPACAKVLTRTERQVLDIVFHLRRRCLGEAMQSAGQLCNRRPPEQIVDAAVELVTRLPSYRVDRTANDGSDVPRRAKQAFLH